MRSLLLVTAFVGAGVLALPAAADENVKGVTFEELESALSAGFQVQRDETEKGNKFLIVKGSSHIIAAYVMTCGGDTSCDGVRYFSILRAAPSADAINKFNLGSNYSKVGLSENGTAVISLDHYVGGGVTAQNLLRTGAVLMAGMSKLGETQNISAVGKPSTTALLSFDTAWTTEGLSKDRAGLMKFSVDPALVRLFDERLEGAP